MPDPPPGPPLRQPCDPHLFHRGTARIAREMLDRGRPQRWLVGCAVCGQSVDVLAALRPLGPRPSRYARAVITTIVDEPKATLQYYLKRQRGHLLAKLDGLGEREVRWPMTPTGTNLLGLVKHVASVQLEYLGDVFDRPSGRPLPWLSDDAETNADMWVPADQAREEIVELHRFSAEHSDATIDALDLDSPGTVPWWPPERRRVTLHQILVHVTAETARHAGHADILRELVDGAAGNDGSLPDQSAEEWATYRSRLEQAARDAGASGSGSDEFSTRRGS